MFLRVPVAGLVGCREGMMVLAVINGDREAGEKSQVGAMKETEG